ncbi:MAG: hypothetical protein HFG97_05190 [Dorea sp.]|jgi:FOG: Glucan-binding domain (YG repeat)|nr:hypothetical protein [Dorea sp.]
MNKRRRRKLKLFLLPVLMICIFMAALPLQAGAATNTKAKASKKERWVTKRKQVYYYKSGKKTTGLKEINGKYYYFDKKGVQHTGWQKIKGNYYFFRVANGKKGFMAKSTKVNGVTLKKNGRAKLNSDSRSRLNVLLKANKIAEKATKPTMSKEQKLRACFDYAVKNFQYRGAPAFYKSAHWERSYALDMFDKGHGNCYSYGAAFAYLANAAGYKNAYAISSGGHGWAEVDGKVYDISWHIVDKAHNYYGMSYSLSGADGRPGYKSSRIYVAKI